MNLSALLPLLGPTASRPQAAPGNPESAFADSLLAALSGSFGQPPELAPNPATQGLNALAPGLPTEPETSGFDSAINEVTHHAATSLLRAGFGTEGHQLAKTVPTPAPAKGQAPAALLQGLQIVSSGDAELSGTTENPLPAMTRFKSSDLATAIFKTSDPTFATIDTPAPETKLSRFLPSAPTDTQNSAVRAGNVGNHERPPAINPAQPLQIDAGSLSSLSPSSLLPGDASQPHDVLSAIKGERATSAIALATAGISGPAGTTPIAQAQPQLRQALPSRTDQFSTVGVTNGPILQRQRETPADPANAAVNPKNMASLQSLSSSTVGVTNEPTLQRQREASADPAKAAINLNSNASSQSHSPHDFSPQHTPSPEQRVFPDQGSLRDGENRQLIVQPSQTIARNDRPLSNAEHLMQVRAETVGGQKGSRAPFSPSPLASAFAGNVVPVESIPDSQRTVEPVNIASPEIARVDPVGASLSKPSIQPAQPANTQIALHIARAIPQGIDRLAVQLHPIELGAVEIQLDFAEDGRVSALITAERPETLDMLQRDSRTLERSLSDTGIQLENGGLSFSLKQEQNRQGQGFNAPSDQRSGAHPGDQDHDGGENEPVRVSQHRLLDIRT